MRVAAVAPEPMTTTFLPAKSSCSGQVSEWTSAPLKVAVPGHPGM